MTSDPDHSNTKAVGIWSAWNDIWFRPIDPIGLHGVRALTGLILFLWLLSFADSYHELLGKEGWFDNEAYRSALRLPIEANVPKSWGRQLIPSSPVGLGILYTVALASAAALTAGLATRITAPACWLLFVAFTSNPVIYYSGDALLQILLMYLAAGYLVIGNPLRSPLGPADAPLWRWRGERRFSSAARCTLRLIQVHFAFIVFLSALHKFQQPEWWAGDALWYPLYPPFDVEASSMLQRVGQEDGTLWMISIGAYLTMLWQLTYPIQPATRYGRVIMLAGAVIGWIWCTFVAGQPVFGPTILIASLAACPESFWQRWIPAGRFANTSS